MNLFSRNAPPLAECVENQQNIAILLVFGEKCRSICLGCKRQFCVANANAKFYGKSRAKFGTFDNLLPKYNIVLGRIYRLFGCYFCDFLHFF